MTMKLPLPATAMSAVFFVCVLGSTALGESNPVSALTDAQQKLRSAVVEDSHGRTIGRVNSVQPATGTPLNVRIALDTPSGPSKLVTIAAADLRYDAGKSAVVTDLSRSDLDAMRNSPSSSSSQP